MISENYIPAEIIIRDENGDYDANAPNPVNGYPQFMGDYPEPKVTKSKIPDICPPVDANTDSSEITRPPRPPGKKLGPFFQFITTDLDRKLWIGSALVFRHVDFNQPHIEFDCDVRIDYQWEILYENLFDLRAYRIHLFIELLSGEGDDEIKWTLDWHDEKTRGSFIIARLDQKWRGGFFSCNGFDAYVPDNIASNLTYSNVWKHLLSVHENQPLHFLLWGGDQNYIDFLFEDIPFLRAWLNMEWNARWTTDFRHDVRQQIEEYHFNTYVENWHRRSEIRQALSSIPSLMMWDDHDIFDGAGSYPPLLHDSPMMMGLFSVAQKMRLLFQHHTTIEKARQHYLFGYNGFNFLARCGKSLTVLGADQRTERDTKTVQHDETWNMIFEKLENELHGSKHLIVLFPVPFSFIRVRIAETIFERIKNLPNKLRKLPVVKQTNSIFGLPELYDDLLDEWTHENHIDERNRILQRFQNFSQQTKIRVTFFSGDVHCCGVSRFQTKHQSQQLSPIHDSKLMYQIISSAIVNMPPSKNAIRMAHRFQTKWQPIENTQEEIIDFFDRKPENGKKAFHKKFRPNRNWCFFEEQPSIQRETSDLKVRFWLESIHQNKDGREFSSYDLIIPNLI